MAWTDGDRRRVRAWVTAGLCGNCGGVRAPGRTHCEKCLLSIRKYAARRKAAAIAAGMCQRCTKHKPATNRKHCPGCLRRMCRWTDEGRERQANARLAGPRCACGLLLPCAVCPSIGDYASSRSAA